MTLIILLLVLVIERVGLNSDAWQASRYVNWYTAKFGNKVKADDSTGLLFFVLAPAVVVGVLLFVFDSRLLDFIVGLLVMGVCVGHYPVRSLYRQYLNAQERKDEEAMAIIHQQLSNKRSVDDVSDSIGETLIWNNFKFYAAPIFFFVVLGIPGVIFYTTLLFLTESETPYQKQSATTHEKAASEESATEESHPLDIESEPSAHQDTLAKWLEWAHFVPARLVSVGFMFVGHFGSGLDAWLRTAGDIKKSPRSILTDIANAAEGIAPSNQNAEIMVRLAKRNMVLFLVVVALLTLYGQIV